MSQERTGTIEAAAGLGAELRACGRRFTLIELLVVMTIIGIIIVFLLNAAMGRRPAVGGARTQSLVAKLENGLNDRLDALMQNVPTPNYAHGYLAGIYPGWDRPCNGPLMLPSAILPTTFFPNPKCNTVHPR